MWLTRYTWQMRTLSVLAALALVVACAPGDSTLPGRSLRATGSRDCLDLSRIAGQRGDGPRRILFETAGGTFRNDLPEVCPGLERPETFTVLVFEPKSGPLCRDDFVRVADTNQLGTLGAASSPRCRLGRFTPISRPAR